MATDHPKKHLNLQTVDTGANTPKKAHPENFARWVNSALAQTNTQQTRYINQRLGDMTKADFLDMIRSDIDYLTEATDPKKFKKDVEGYQREFHDVVLAAPDAKTLLENCEQYIKAEQHYLFYRTNDLVAARIKQDYFNTFLDKVMPALEEDGIIDAAAKKRFGALKEAYQMGFEAYGHSQFEVAELSGDRSRGLLEEAHRAIHADFRKIDSEAFGQKLEAEAVKVANQLMANNYDMNFADQPVPPLMFAIMRQVRSLADIELQQKYPSVNFRDPHVDWQEKFNAIYDPIALGVVDAINKDDSLENFVRISQALKQRIAEKDRIPANFGELIEDASRKASKTVLGRSKDYLLQDRERYKLYEKEGTGMPRSYTMVETLLPGSDSPERVQFDTRTFLAELGKLPKAYSKDSLLTYLENATTVAIDEGLFGWNHPAAMIAAKDWVAEFRRNLGGAMHDAKMHDAAFLAHLKEVEDGIGYAYQSRNIAGDWLMKESQNGTAHLFESTWMQKGWDPRALKKSEVKELMDEARGTLAMMSEARGIPDSMVDHPLIPLIYERCRDVAQAEHDKDMAEQLKKQEKKGGEGWRQRTGFKQRSYRDKIKGMANEELKGESPFKAEQAPAGAEKPEMPSPEAMEKKIVAKMTIDVMRDALARITILPDPEDAKGKKAEAEQDDTLKPYMNSHNLVMLMEYLDARERKACLATSQRTIVH